MLVIHDTEEYTMWSVLATRGMNELCNGMKEHDVEMGRSEESTRAVIRKMRVKIKSIQN
jgi:hypothetical protein